MIQFFEIAFLVMMVLAIFESIRLFRMGNTTYALVFAGFAVLAFFMNRLRRKQRKRLEENERNQS